MEQILLNEKEVADLFKVKATTVKNWRNTNKIPEEVIFKIEGNKTTVRYIKSKVIDWINGDIK